MNTKSFYTGKKIIYIWNPKSLGMIIGFTQLSTIPYIYIWYLTIYSNNIWTFNLHILVTKPKNPFWVFYRFLIHNFHHYWYQTCVHISWKCGPRLNDNVNPFFLITAFCCRINFEFQTAATNCDSLQSDVVKNRFFPFVIKGVETTPGPETTALLPKLILPVCDPSLFIGSGQ